MTTLQWVKGHNGNEDNEQADHLASFGAVKLQEDEVDLSIPQNFDLQGARLQSISQATTYKSLTRITHLEDKHKTTELLYMARHAIHQMSRMWETNVSIWNSCRKKDISKIIQLFIYKTLHNAH